MSYICPQHKDNPNWNCFESNGSITHVEGTIHEIDSKSKKHLVLDEFKNNTVPEINWVEDTRFIGKIVGSGIIKGN